MLLKIIVHGHSSKKYPTLNSRAENRVKKAIRATRATKVTKVSKEFKDRKAFKALKVFKAFKALKVTKVTREIRVTHLLGTKFQHQHAKNSKVKRVTKAIQVILVSTTAQLSLKSTKRNSSGSILQKKNQLLQSTLLTFLAFKRNLTLKSNFQPKSLKELNSSQL
nr:MAG TPA: hypothetical protein [Bacteriophage sp.]